MPERHYRRNCLTKVILRVNYEPLQALQSQQDSPLSDRVRSDFPVVAGHLVGTVKVNFGPTGSGMQQEITGKQWEHRKVEGGTKILFLSQEHLSLEYGQGDFDHFPPFQAEFATAFNSLIQLYPEVRVTRVGLRYVNQIRMDQGNPMDWDNLIASHLVAAAKAGMLEGSSLVRSMHQLHVRKDDLNLLVHYGIFNPEYPATISRREFILDFDCYRKEDMASNEVLATIASLNSMSETMFEECILDGLRQHMELINV